MNYDEHEIFSNFNKLLGGGETYMGGTVRWFRIIALSPERHMVLSGFTMVFLHGKVQL